MIKREFFEDLFVLEMANNHWGKLERGLKIIEEFSRVVRFNNVRASIKLQFRDVQNFIHKDFRVRQDIRYIKKTIDTRMSRNDLATLVDAIRAGGCIPSATPFDEASVDFCEELNLPFLKLASSDVNDWFLIEKMAKTQKPILASSGGTTEKDLDDLVSFCEKRQIVLGINHCVSLYPTPKDKLELNQIDYLKNRYPQHVIGFSTHEFEDWEKSVSIAYAKGARTFERHIDIQEDGPPLSPYCSKPQQIDSWIKSYKMTKEMCGNSSQSKRICSLNEIKYLDTLIRGVYANKTLQMGTELSEKDVYLAVPIQKGQISSREFIKNKKLLKNVTKDEPISIDALYNINEICEQTINTISNRGI